MHHMDCLGDICPLPLMKLIQCRETLDKGENVLLVTDHSCTCESILSYCQKQKIHTQIAEPIPGVWEITMSMKPDAT
ncbi:MAG TPA: sulfurtransferase TusA family protein [Candidatus Limiplasma sp.]|nr:sulfurtransferase TusA family protein [Candidatus Limiplasma sp.]HRX09948.1 sulfurtransferase TusA family protein [Candidatus Limiplasma sp.]